MAKQQRTVDNEVTDGTMSEKMYIRSADSNRMNGNLHLFEHIQYIRSINNIAQLILTDADRAMTLVLQWLAQSQKRNLNNFANRTIGPVARSFCHR